MCGTCGCSEPSERFEPAPAKGFGVRAAPPVRAEHDHDHEHAHRVERIEQDILRKNDDLAGKNRAELRRRGVLAINLMSSPGSGKTTLLERTIRESKLGDGLLVIQGDQATDRDAERIRRAGARATQINTGQGCHLDAAMVARAIGELDPPRGALLAIENVGNLVCPALFDLG
ncbi:MAG TPA: hydrogenase nickel incorporation protein HypB, partial [Polyangiales bacterium]|nr:hydrogenase nickel incorporation protein HypB [Polyangiales bacterium]